MQLKYFKEFHFRFDFGVLPSFEKLKLETKKGSKSEGSTPGK